MKENNCTKKLRFDGLSETRFSFIQIAVLSNVLTDWSVGLQVCLTPFVLLIFLYLSILILVYSNAFTHWSDGFCLIVVFSIGEF